MAAKDGFEIVWSNPLRYAVVSGIGEIIMFLGKLMIASATVAAFYALITFYSAASSAIQQPIAMLIIVGLIAFAVAMVFMSVYSLAMDTLLACFIVD